LGAPASAIAGDASRSAAVDDNRSGSSLAPGGIGGAATRGSSTTSLSGAASPAAPARFIASPIRLMPSSEEREPSPLPAIGEPVRPIGGRSGLALEHARGTEG